MFLMLAQSATPPDGSGATYAGIVAVLGAVATIVGHITGKKAGRAESVEIKGQPLLVRMQEEFVTRREFERLEASMGTAAAEMKGLFERTMQAMEMRDKSVNGKIERLGDRLKQELLSSNSSHQEARGRIHQKVNQHGEQIAALEREFSVSRSLGEFGNAIREVMETGKEKANG